MNIEKKLYINDEPWVANCSNKRTATLKYQGPKYLYLEYDNTTNNIEALAHISEFESDMNGAFERCTPIEGREIIEINAEERLIVACHFWNVYTLSLENYVEELENGETYKYEYSEDTNLGEIYDFNKMVWNKTLKDYDEYKFLIHPVSDSEMSESIDSILGKVQDALANNTSLTDEYKLEIQQYITTLNKFKLDMAAGVENWKMQFPICKIPY
jgi:hypothetical protein